MAIWIRETEGTEIFISEKNSRFGVERGKWQLISLQGVYLVQACKMLTKSMFILTLPSAWHNSFPSLQQLWRLAKMPLGEIGWSYGSWLWKSIYPDSGHCEPSEESAQHRSMQVLLEMKRLSWRGYWEVGASILLECKETDLNSNPHHLKRELNVCK